MVVDTIYGKQFAFCAKILFVVTSISPLVCIARKEFKIVLVGIYCSLVSLLCVCVCRRIFAKQGGK